MIHFIPYNYFKKPLYLAKILIVEKTLSVTFRERGLDLFVLEQTTGYPTE